MTSFPSIRLDKMLKELSNRNTKSLITSVSSVTNTTGFVPSDETFSKQVFSSNISNYKIVREGEFAYNPSRVNVGSIDYLRGTEPVAVSPMYVVFTVDYDVLNREYLLYFLKSELGLAWIDHMTAGSVRDTLRFSDLGRIQIPLPPLPEQERIVAILRQADDLRRLRAQANQRAQDLLPTLFYEMFGDLYSEEHIPEGWTSAPISEYFSDTQYGISASLLEHSEGNIGILRMNNITTEGALNLEDMKYLSPEKVDLEKYGLQPGDLLFNRTNSKELVGKTGLWEMQESDDFSFASYIIRIRLKENTVPEFMWAALNSPYGKAQMNRLAKQAVNMANINTGELGSIQIALPPKPVQEKFKMEYGKVKEQLNRQKTAEALFEELFQSLLARAFTGELTAAWRESHQEELERAAAERDALLGGAAAAAQETMPAELIQLPLPAVQPQRSIHERLDKGLQKLLAAIAEFPAYFRPQDLVVPDELTPIQTEAGLGVLAALGFVRQVQIDGRLVWRLVDALGESAEKPAELLA